MTFTPSMVQHWRVPACRALGAHAGNSAAPLLLVVGGMHGNEYSGVLAARRVLDKLAPEDLLFGVDLSLSWATWQPWPWTSGSSISI
jgi:hypothetical protein